MKGRGRGRQGEQKKEKKEEPRGPPNPTPLPLVILIKLLPLQSGAVPRRASCHKQRNSNNLFTSLSTEPKIFLFLP